jgi:ATP-binding cassette subfamily F protein 3
MLNITNLTYRIGARVLLDDTGVAVNPGHRVGLVGRNGTGKTTLLRLITGELSPASGTIEIPRRWQVGITSQEAPNGPRSLIDTVMAADRELVSLLAEAETATDPERIGAIHMRLADKDAHSAESRAAVILAGLGFDDAAQKKPCNDYSGGWRMRVALAGLLFTQPDLLLLDEPTNHLDLEATLWLEDYLRGYPGTILLVSHDRELLNRAVDEILHLENGKMTLYRGGYDRFEATRRMRLEQNEKLRVKQNQKRAEIESFVARFRAKATKAKQAQSRLKMLERMQPIAEHYEEGSISFMFPEPEELSPPLYNMDKVAIGYDGKPVLSNLSLRLDTDDRVALLGANGNGKSTLIKLLAGRLAPLSGEVSKSSKLRVGYFAQHQAEELDLNITPVLEMQRRRPQDSEQALRNHLGRFGFGQQKALTKISSLSGGEKARLLFALMTIAKPHILLLDEPTNHLDMDSRQALVEAINAFEGAVVLISHDPHVLELTVDRFWLVDGGRIRPFEGDMDDYRAHLLGREPRRSESRDQSRGGDGANKKDERRKAAEKRNALSPLKKRIEQAERLVAKIEAERAKLKQSMADPKLYSKDVGRLLDMQKELGQIEKSLAAAETDWVTLQEEYEQLQISAAQAANG